MPDTNAFEFLRASRQYGSRLALERIARLCELLGDPQDRPASVHVAGTNGKGSTCAMTASILTAAGCRTGLYLSPHIEDIGECLFIDGKPISPEEFERTARKIRDAADVLAREGDPPTEFELETAIAFQWFADRGCQWIVIETGLGGRLDATNVIHSPRVAALTSISLDHTHILGDTIGKIAAEKCGILKPGCAVVTDPNEPDEAMAVIRERAAALGCELIVPDARQLTVQGENLAGLELSYHDMELHIPFVGRHQAANAAIAVEIARTLRDRCSATISDQSIAKGIGAAVLPLRQEILSRCPLVLVDGAHNPDGLKALAGTMSALLGGKRIAVVMGMLADKDIASSIPLIAGLAHLFLAVEPTSPRALPAKAAAAAARGHCPEVAAESTLAMAVARALDFAGQDGAVVVCGSLYLAAPARRLLLERLGADHQRQ